MNDYDIIVFQKINDISKSYDFLNQLIIFIAKDTVYILAFLMIIVWLLTKDKIHTRVILLTSLISYAIAGVLGHLIKMIEDHPRPYYVLDNVNQLVYKPFENSFPSDHTLLFFAILMLFYFTSKSKFKSLYIIIAICAGISRIYVGVHYPSDILAAAIISSVVAYLCYKFIYPSKLVLKAVLFYNVTLEKVLQKLGIHKN